MIIFEKEVDLKNYHPSVEKDSREFIELANSENPEFKLMYEACEEAFNNQFIETALDYGLSQWEKILNLPTWDEDTLDDRRQAINMALISSLPYTYRKLEEILTNICGQGGYKIDLTPNDFTIKIGVSLGSKRQRDIVDSTMEDILPKNLIYTVSLLYNRHIDLARFTHEDLHQFNHYQLKEEVLPNG